MLLTFKSNVIEWLGEMKDEILAQVREGKSLEISYSNGEVIVRPYQGIRRVSLGKGELKGVRKRRGRVKPAVIRVLDGVVERLLNAKEPFKVIVGRGDVEVRFNLDQYIKIESKAIKIVGFESSNEKPLSLVFDVLPRNVPLKFLKPIK